MLLSTIVGKLRYEEEISKWDILEHISIEGIFTISSLSRGSSQ